MSNKTYFVKNVVTLDHNQPDAIAKAYRALGLTPPEQVQTLEGVVTDGYETPESVAKKFLFEYAGVKGDHTAARDEAVAAIETAQARQLLIDTLRHERQGIGAAASKRQLPDAFKKFKAPFAKLVIEFSDAAARLPEGEYALDAEANIANDSADALTTVRRILPKLSTIAAMHLHIMINGGYNQIGQLATIDVLIATDPEVSAYTLGSSLRALAEGIRANDVDLALVNLARGDYEGLSIGLAENRPSHRHRLAQLMSDAASIELEQAVEKFPARVL